MKHYSEDNTQCSDRPCCVTCHFYGYELENGLICLRDGQRVNPWGACELHKWPLTQGE